MTLEILYQDFRKKNGLPDTYPSRHDYPNHQIFIDFRNDNMGLLNDNDLYFLSNFLTKSHAFGFRFINFLLGCIEDLPLSFLQLIISKKLSVIGVDFLDNSLIKNLNRIYGFVRLENFLQELMNKTQCKNNSKLIWLMIFQNVYEDDIFWKDHQLNVRSFVSYSWASNRYIHQFSNSINEFEVNEYYQVLSKRYNMVLNTILKVQHQDNLLEILSLLKPLNRNSCPKNLLNLYDQCKNQIE